MTPQTPKNPVDLFASHTFLTDIVACCERSEAQHKQSLPFLETELRPNRWISSETRWMKVEELLVSPVPTVLGPIALCRRGWAGNEVGERARYVIQQSSHMTVVGVV